MILIVLHRFYMVCLSYFGLKQLIVSLVFDPLVKYVVLVFNLFRDFFGKNHFVLDF